MEKLDIKTALRSTLTQKQELVRDYQTYAKQIQDANISRLFSHFAEAEALHATQIKEQLENLQ